MRVADTARSMFLDDLQSLVSTARFLYVGQRIADKLNHDVKR